MEEASTSVLPYSRPSRSSTLFASLAATGDAARTANDVRAEVVRLLVNADANLKSTGPEGGGTGEAAGEEASSTAATPSLSAGSPESGFALLRQPPSGLSSAAAMALACDVDGRCALAVAAGLADSGAYHAVEAGLASVGGGIKSFGVIALASACLDADVAAARWDCTHKPILHFCLSANIHLARTSTAPSLFPRTMPTCKAPLLLQGGAFSCRRIALPFK